MDQAGAPTTLFERMVELEEVVNSTVPDVDEILLAPADKIDHAAALEARIDFFERLECLLSGAIDRVLSPRIRPAFAPRFR